MTILKTRVNVRNERDLISESYVDCCCWLKLINCSGSDAKIFVIGCVS